MAGLACRSVAGRGIAGGGSVRRHGGPNYNRDVAAVRSSMDTRTAADTDVRYARTFLLRSALYVRLYSVLHAAQILSPLGLWTVFVSS